MASGRGSSPFNGDSVDVRNESEVEALRRWQNSHRKNRFVRFGDDGLAKNSGYHRKPSKSSMKTLTDSLGNQYRTPDMIDYDDFVDMFHIRPEGQLTEEYKNDPKRQNLKSLADWCHWSFDREDSNFDEFWCPEGHIERVEYNNSSKIMRVSFVTDGAIACYFYVPAEIYQTLKHLSDGMPTRTGRDGKPRHLVGIYFWNLVRVRGTIHGNRYQCCYVSSGDGGGYVKVPNASKEDVSRMEEEDAAKRRGVEADLRRDGQHGAADILSGKVDPEETKNMQNHIWKQRLGGQSKIEAAGKDLRERARRLLEERKRDDE